MSDQKNKAERFRALHVPGHPVVLFNVWDAGGAKAVTAAGAQAIATGSWSVAAAHGYEDGEKVPLDFAADNWARIVQATELPVTVDIETGYGAAAEAVARTVARTLEAGAIGCNLEDSYVETGKLRPAADQAQRLRAARQAAGGDYFINARTDVFFQKPAAEHDAAMVEEALERARAYAGAGADGLFAPGLTDPALIARLTGASPLPVNIMVGGGSPTLKVLAEAGAARLSFGPGPYLSMMKALEQGAREAFASVG